MRSTAPLTPVQDKYPALKTDTGILYRWDPFLTRNEPVIKTPAHFFGKQK